MSQSNTQEEAVEPMKLPTYSFLVPASLLLGLAPFVPEPHLVEKIRWLLTGHPFRPIDIFDVFLHGALPTLLLVKLVRDLLKFGGRGLPEPSEPGPESNSSSLEPRGSRAQKDRKARKKRRGG